MGKATGFLEYDRKKNPAASPSERIEHFNEFHRPLLKEERQEQGARCMNCGVPFCQSAMVLHGSVTGCPLHNLIPEWNDEIYQGNWEHALARLRKSNNFPEFTGRVCPALCEAACTCGLYDEPVTVKENELFVIETGFQKGYVQPAPPAVRTGKKVAVVGSGPSGLACADRLNRRGHSVTVFEKEDRPGGLLMYGIPNMKLEKWVVDRRISLMKEEGVEFVCSRDIRTAREVRSLRKDFDAVVLCCGAGQPRGLQATVLADGDGKEAATESVPGVYFAVDFLKSTTKALLAGPETACGRREAGVLEGSAAAGLSGDYISAAGKDVVVVGGGDTGNDCVGTAIRHGCKSVVQLEMMAKPPVERPADNQWPQWPKVLKTDYGQEEALDQFGRDPRIFQTTVKALLTGADGSLRAVQTVRLEEVEEPAGDGKPEEGGHPGRRVMKEVPGSEAELPADLLLVAAGFLGPQDYVAKAFGVKTETLGGGRTAIAASDRPAGTRQEGMKTGGSTGGGCAGAGQTGSDSGVLLLPYQTSVPGIFAAGDCRRGQSLVVWAIAEGRSCARSVDQYMMNYTNMI